MLCISQSPCLHLLGRGTGEKRGRQGKQDGEETLMNRESPQITQAGAGSGGLGDVVKVGVGRAHENLPLEAK